MAMHLVLGGLANNWGGDGVTYRTATSLGGQGIQLV